MAENLEMHTILSNKIDENDIQEYDEIREEDQFEDTRTTFTLKPLTKTLNEYDFFTKHVKTSEKTKTKKKKTKQKGKSSNLMDIISSEIAASVVPLKENVISLVTNGKKQHNSYLETTTHRYLNAARPYFIDSEQGWSQKKQVIRISPIFPRVLENIATDDSLTRVTYVEPLLFEDIVVRNFSKDKGNTTKFLDITLNNIQFKHHYLFSLEKLLAVKLEESYNEYVNIKKLLKDVWNDIKVNRETKDNLKKDLMKVSPNKIENIRFDPTIRKYIEKMLQSKEKYRETIKIMKEITHRITSLWSDIELIREKRGRSETIHILRISKKVLEDKELEMKWHETFNTEFADMLEKIEYDFVSQYLEYKEVKNNLRSNSAKKPAKPKFKIDEITVKIEVENLVNELVTEENVDLVLRVDSSNCRKDRSEINFHFKIYMDDVFICESEHYSSDDMFKIEFVESFSVQILPNNDTLQIILLENERKVSCIDKKLSNIKKTNTNPDFFKENFIYSDKIEPNINTIGSGYTIKDIVSANKVRLKSSNLFKNDLQTYCEINMKIGWNDKLEQNRTDNIKASIEIGRKLKRFLHGIDKPDSDILLETISNIYEQDINDLNMIETVKNLCNMEIKTDGKFPINESNLDLVRLNLLHLRNTGHFTNIQNKTIPLYASQITTEHLDCLQKTKTKDFDVEYLNTKEMEMDPIELQRFIGAKYVQKLNKNMLKNLNHHLMKKTHKDVVRDFDISWRSLFSIQSNLATSGTMTLNKKQQMLKECRNKEQEIQVTVLRAFNLLDRSKTVLEEDVGFDDDDSIAGFKVRPLRPYVRISYKGVTAQTVTAIGCHPTWSHTLKINTVLEPISCLHINIYDEYKANINDGFSEDEQSNKTVHYRYYSKWLGTLEVPLHTVLTLGTLRGTFKITTPPLIFGYETLQTKDSSSIIPEISQLMKKEASYITLQITTNLSHLGGLHVYNQPLPSSIEDDYLIKHLNNFVSEYTNEFPSRNISLTFIDSAGRNKCVTQFLQPIPLPKRDFLPKNPRGESALSKSSGRSSSSSGRRKELDVERTSQEERESVYSTHDADNLTKMINACMRYVSLIPCYEVTESHVVTLLGLEILKVLHGSPLDHTILLASYFIYLGVKCWVAIGLGLPRCLSSYVLIKYDLATRRVVLENDQIFRSRGFLNKTDGYTWYVCDGASGERFELRDVGCPLKGVHYVFDNENIWVNIQSSQDSENVSFDFSRSSDWQSVFDKSVFVMKQPVVTDSALYSAPAGVEALRGALENKLKLKVQKWRSHMKTIWNRYCSGLLREMLPQWEIWAFNQSSPKPGFSHKLKQLMVTYKLFGFPLNMPYLNTKSVISAVKSTGLHVTDDPKVEFAMAVEVYAYPNNVISVWVFLASITRI